MKPVNKKQSQQETDPSVAILTTQGYFNRHFELCMTEDNQENAYEKLEEEYKKLTQKNRCKTYEAFRTAKTRYYQNAR